MTNHERMILRLLETRPGLSDRELANAIKGPGAPYNYVNQSCRGLASRGILQRRKRTDGLIGNWPHPGDSHLEQLPPRGQARDIEEYSERKLKQVLESFLVAAGWEAEIAWGLHHGIDIKATRGGDTWVIEVKGLEPDFCVPAIIFVTLLGEILQRMDDYQSKYSIALPDMEQFRRLWDRLPNMVKSLIFITVLFVDPAGYVDEKM